MSDVKEIKISNTVYDIVGKGVENQRDTSKAKVWVGSNAQYNDLQNLDGNTVYYRTDNGGTVQTAVNASNAANDGSGNNIEETYAKKDDAADAVVDYQLPTTENNYAWYRLYASGWVEQGGIEAVPDNDNSHTISLPITMADTNYFVTFQRSNVNTGTVSTGYIGDSTICSYTTTSFSTSRGFNSPVRWEVKGMSAQGA